MNFPAFQALGASFSLGVRAPFRSKLVAAVLLLLAVVLVVLPAQLKGDGTDAGVVRMVLTWTLGAATFLLAVVSLWAGCASFSSELSEKRHVLAAVSPAGTFALWAGRWLGLVAIDAVLLAIALFGVWAQLRIRGLGADRTPVRMILREDGASREQEAQRIIAFSFPEGTDDANRTARENAEHREKMVAQVVSDLKGDTFLPIHPGSERRWVLHVPEGVQDRVQAEFSFVAPYGMDPNASGKLVFRHLGQDAPFHECQVFLDGGGERRFDLPSEPFRNAGAIDVRFINPLSETSAAILLCHSRALRVSVPGGSLECNLLRSGIAILALLSILSALGLACGCCFSPPVAAFVATALCIMVGVSGGEVFSGEGPAQSGHSHVDQGTKKLSERVLPAARAVARSLDTIIEPVDSAAPLDRLGDGIRVGGTDAMRAFGIDGMLLPLLLGCVGAAILRQRWGNTA